jgi:hypothetical protein
MFSGVSCCGVAVGRRPTSVQADAAIAAAIGGETRTTTLAIEGTTPHPPRRLTRPLGSSLFRYADAKNIAGGSENGNNRD